jgi:hypothetical protein
MSRIRRALAKRDVMLQLNGSPKEVRPWFVAPPRPAQDRCAAWFVAALGWQLRWA